LKTLKTRIGAARKRATTKLSFAFHNERGAFDLPSILVGVLVVAVMALGVMAVVFGIIPFSQDKSAEQTLAAVATAEGTYYGQSNSLGTATIMPGSSYAGLADLKTEKFLGADVTGLDATGGDKGWVAVTKSDSGKWYWATSESPKPVTFTPLPADVTSGITVVLSKQVIAFTPAKIGAVNGAG
jgi:type II secretory pathway pseudopilin PulG